MEKRNVGSAFVLGAFLFLGLAVLGWQAGRAAVDVKLLERSVTVKGLSEREYPADVVIWPIQYTDAGNDLQALYTSLDESSSKIRAFLAARGLEDSEVSVTPPVINDKSAQQYGGGPRAEFRYSAQQSVTVYSGRVREVRDMMKGLSDLGRQGIVFSGGNYDTQPEYLFTRLNEVKPEMIEEATTKAREVAEKFAADSASRLGKIRRASQGQFSISPRDRNNPHIKKVRVVSTVEYYLSD
ncbi:MAG: SIMPL domain-containing protein [Gammaproteobacteria bacterium]|nr:SIMPL domain-containing protein [Gammaproteobacteria bacterium]